MLRSLALGPRLPLWGFSRRQCHVIALRLLRHSLIIFLDNLPLPLDTHISEASGVGRISNTGNGSKAGRMNEWSFLLLTVFMSSIKCLGSDWGGKKGCEKAPKDQWLKTQRAGFESLSLPLSSCVTSGKLLNLLGPRFHHLLNGDNNTFCLLDLL